MKFEVEISREHLERVREIMNINGGMEDDSDESIIKELLYVSNDKDEYDGRADVAVKKLLEMKCTACSIKGEPVIVVPRRYNNIIVCPLCESEELEEVKE